MSETSQFRSHIKWSGRCDTSLCHKNGHDVLALRHF
jgi:hypothetical protein